MKDKWIVPQSLEDDVLLLKQFDNITKKKEANVTKPEDDLKKLNKNITKNRRKNEKVFRNYVSTDGVCWVICQ